MSQTWGLRGREVKVYDRGSHVPSPLWVRVSQGVETLYERKLSSLLVEGQWFFPRLSRVLPPPLKARKVSTTAVKGTLNPNHESA